MSFFGPFVEALFAPPPFAPPFTDDGVDGVATGELFADVDGEAFGLAFVFGELIWPWWYADGSIRTFDWFGWLL